jgi:hypothetical protein
MNIDKLVNDNRAYIAMWVLTLVLLLFGIWINIEVRRLPEVGKDNAAHVR